MLLLYVSVSVSVMSVLSAISQKNTIFRYSKLVSGTLHQRYKRFLADVDLNGDGNELPANAETIVAHCPNTGSMLTLVGPANPYPQCILSISDNLKRKYRHTLEYIKLNKTFVGVHSALANNFVENALNSGLITEITGFDSLRREVPIGGDSKIDFELMFGTNRFLVEVKSVTLAYTIEKKDSLLGSISLQNRAEFPDCVSLRAQKHAKTLTDFVRKGYGNKAAIIFLIQRDDCDFFSPSDLDPTYQFLVSDASRAGVLILPYQCQLNLSECSVEMIGRIPFVDPVFDEGGLMKTEVSIAKGGSSPSKNIAQPKSKVKDGDKIEVGAITEIVIDKKKRKKSESITTSSNSNPFAEFSFDVQSEIIKLSTQQENVKVNKKKK